MDLQELGLRELYEVTIKATYPMEVNGRSIEEGETVVAFDKIQMATLAEDKSIVAATGGYDNRGRVFWESTRDVQIQFSQGVFSKAQFAVLNNAKLIEIPQPTLINNREIAESDAEGLVKFKHEPSGKFFIYDAESGARIEEYELVDETTIKVEQSYRDYLLDYHFNYAGATAQLLIGERLTQGFFQLEGKTRTKDDITGQVKTGIIRVPRLKLVSRLSMRLGENASPQVGSFNALAVPTGKKGETKVMEILFLDNDIDSDM